MRTPDAPVRPTAARAASGVAVTAAAAAWVLSAWVHAQGAAAAGSGDPLVGAVATGWALTGAVLVLARPRNSVGWLLLGLSALQAWSVAAVAYGGYGTRVPGPDWPAAPWVAQLGAMAWLPSMVLPVSVLLAVYPSGRLPSRWWRWPVATCASALTVLTVVATLSQDAFDDVAPGTAPLVLPDGWLVPVLAASAAVALLGGAATIWAATLVRLARARAPERQQLAWLVGVAALLLLAVFVIPTSRHGVLVPALLLPVAIAIGVLRYGALGIVVSSGFVYVVLTGAVLAVYVAVAAAVGAAALDLSQAPLPGAVTAAVVAVTLTPAQRRLQRVADRLVYGERHDPFRAVTRLGARVSESDERELLPAVLDTVSAALRSPGAEVLAPGGRVLARVGDTDAQALRDVAAVALRVGGREVGTLRLAPRRPGEVFTAADQQLLEALAAQVAAVVRALDLAESLHRERDQVVAARHSERDRLRRDLHDGLGPALAGISLGLQAAQGVAGADGPTAALLARLRAEADDTLGEVRRVIDDLRPARLDDLGLVAAVRRHADAVSSTLAVDVDADDLPPLPPQVEAAAYRIAQEALTNVIRHSGARSARVSLALDGPRLVVRVVDDGRGLAPERGIVPAPRSGGVGLSSMRHRAEVLGGRLLVDDDADGTRLEAVLPLGGV